MIHDSRFTVYYSQYTVHDSQREREGEIEREAMYIYIYIYIYRERERERERGIEKSRGERGGTGGERRDTGT